MHSQSIISMSVLSLALSLSGPALGQSSHNQHHPEGKTERTNDTGSMPKTKQMMGKGMMRGGMTEMMGGQCPMMNSGNAETHAAGRIAFIKAELAITDAQQSAWENYAIVLKKKLEGMKAMRSGMMANMKVKSPVERLSAHISAMENRLVGLKEEKPVLEKLYATLSEEQKNKADKILTGMGCMG